MSHPSNRVRRPQRRSECGESRQGFAAQVHAARGVEHPAAYYIPRARHQSGASTIGELRPMSASVSPPPAPVLTGHYTYASITDKISDIVLRRPMHRGWIIGGAIALAFTVLF